MWRVHLGFRSVPWSMLGLKEGGCPEGLVRKGHCHVHAACKDAKTQHVRRGAQDSVGRAAAFRQLLGSLLQPHAFPRVPDSAFFAY